MTNATEVQLQRGQEWLETLLQLCQLAASVEPSLKPSLTADLPEEPDTVGWLTLAEENLTSDQIALFLGNRGAVIDSIQYLANLILNLNREATEQLPFMIELCQYRAKRQDELQNMADQAIAHVRDTGEEYELQSLSSAERRQVHTLLKAFPDLETFSRGREPDRHLVVKPSQDSSAALDESE